MQALALQVHVTDGAQLAKVRSKQHPRLFPVRFPSSAEERTALVVFHLLATVLAMGTHLCPSLLRHIPSVRDLQQRSTRGSARP